MRSFSAMVSLAGGASLFRLLLVSLLAADLVTAQRGNIRQPASITYQARGDCPELCSTSGPNYANWTVYQTLDQVSRCQETVFYYLSIHDNFNDTSSPHRFYACTSFGTPQKPGVAPAEDAPAVQKLSNASFTLGAWQGAPSSKDQGLHLASLSRQTRFMLDAGYAADNDTALYLFVQRSEGTAGLYVGKGVQAHATASQALQAFEGVVSTTNNDTNIDGAALQLCENGYDGDHTFGFIATSNLSFAHVQAAVQSWANATCLDFDLSQNITGTVGFTTPLVLLPTNGTLNGTSNSNSTNSTLSSRWTPRRSMAQLNARGDCSTVQVVSGDGCASLATKCGISGADFTKYNSASNFCSTLAPGQHVCCSAGTLPDFSPKPNSDGSCASYTIVADDTCSGLAAARSLTVSQIESFNTQTWSWNGCSLLYVGVSITIFEAICGMDSSLTSL
jgi:hypothetical protein